MEEVSMLELSAELCLPGGLHLLPGLPFLRAAARGTSPGSCGCPCILPPSCHLVCSFYSASELMMSPDVVKHWPRQGTDYSDVFLLFLLYSASFTVVHIISGISFKHTPGSLLPIQCILLMHPERDSHMHILDVLAIFFPFFPLPICISPSCQGIRAIVAI